MIGENAKDALVIQRTEFVDRLVGPEMKEFGGICETILSSAVTVSGAQLGKFAESILYKTVTRWIDERREDKTPEEIYPPITAKALRLASQINEKILSSSEASRLKVKPNYVIYKLIGDSLEKIISNSSVEDENPFL
jgi:hypothetical protein